MDTPDFWARWAKVNEEKDLKNRVYRVSDDPVMVNNNCVVLDEGQLKFLPECISMGYDKEIWDMIVRDWRTVGSEICHAEVDDDPWSVRHDMRPWMCKQYARRMGIKPFTPFLTFNISPNWGDTPQGVRRIKFLQICIEKFFAISQRFQKIEYTIGPRS